MSEKIYYNNVFIQGELLDILNAQRLNKGTDMEKLKFTFKVNANGDHLYINFEEDKIKFGQENSRFKAVETMVNTYIPASESANGGDIIKLTCRLENNRYYKEGNFISRTVIAGQFATRGAKGSPYQMWKDTWVYIEDMQDMEDETGKYLLVTGIVSKYTKHGCRVDFRIYDEELMTSFKGFYKVGQVAKLEGKFAEFVLPVREEDIRKAEEEYEKAKAKYEEEIAGNKTIGSRAPKPAVFKEPKERVIRWAEITGGEEAFEGSDLEGTLFSKENLELIIEGIENSLSRNKDRDAAKHGLGNDDLPF